MITEQKVLKKINKREPYEYKTLLDKNNFGWTPLKIILHYNASQDLNFSNGQIVWIGERSDLSVLNGDEFEIYNNIKIKYEKEQLSKILNRKQTNRNFKI